MLEQEQVSGGACVYRTNFTLHGLKESHLQVCLGRPASAGPVRSWDRMNGLDVGVLVMLGWRTTCPPEPSPRARDLLVLLNQPKQHHRTVYSFKPPSL